MQMTRQKSNSSSLLLGIKIVWGLPVVMAKNYSKCIPTSHGPQVAAPENSHTTSCLFPFLEGLPRLGSTKGAGSEATLLTPPSLPSCSASLIQSCADCFCDNVICWISIVQFLPTRTNVSGFFHFQVYHSRVKVETSLHILWDNGGHLSSCGQIPNEGLCVEAATYNC